MAGNDAAAVGQGGFFAADWVIDAGVVLVAAAAALLLHYLLEKLFYRLLNGRRRFVSELLSRISGPTRLALVLLAMALVLAVAPLAPGAAAPLGRVLLLAIIALLGWTALMLVGLTADLYLGRLSAADADSELARKHRTQVRILKRAVDGLIVVITTAAALMTFEPVRQYGVSLFASAGLVSIVVGLAARPVLSNLIAGIQIAMTQPIRLEDAVVVENEFGFIEEIAATYVVVRLWDRRRLLVPLSYFIEKPFQNWTRQSTELTGSIVLYVDYSAPLMRLREKLADILAHAPLWDRQVASLQVIEAKETTMQLQVLVSAANAAALGDLKAEVREKLIAFLQDEYPQALPRQRAEVELSRFSANLATAAVGDAGARPGERSGAR